MGDGTLKHWLPLSRVRERGLGGEGLLLILLLLSVACSRPAPPPPTPTVILPTPIPTPSQNTAAQFDEDPSDVEIAFRTEVQQVVDQANFLTGAPCDRLDGAMRQDPTMVNGLYAYAAMMKTLSTQDQALDRPGTPSVLKQMDDALAELDQHIASCGIKRR